MARYLLEDVAAASTISRITTQTTSGIGSTSATATYPATPTAGNLLIAVVTATGNGTELVSNAGWIRAIDNGSSSGMAIFYKVAGASEPRVVSTINDVSSATVNLVIHEYTGFSGTPTFDTKSTASGAGGGTTISTGFTPTTNATNELLFAAAFVTGGATASGTPWSNAFTAINTTTNSNITCSAEKIVTSTGSYETTLTVSGTTTGLYSGILTFKDMIPNTTDSFLLEDGTSYFLLEDNIPPVITPITGSATYYMDGSVTAPASSNGSAFLGNIQKAFDGDITTFASDSSVVGYGSAAGTTASASNTGTISSVNVRAYARMTATNSGTVTIYDSGTLIGTITVPANSSPATWRGYVTLTVPTGGWTWTKIKNLEARLSATGGVRNGNLEVSLIQVEVIGDPASFSTTTPTLEFTATDPDPANDIQYEVQIDTVSTFDSVAGTALTPTLIQTAKITNAAATPGTAVLTGVTAGNMILVNEVVGSGTAGLMTGVTDSAGNTYTKAYEKMGTGVGISQWYAYNVTGGNVTVSVAFNDVTADISAIIREYSNISTTNPIDGVAQTSSGASTAVSSANYTPTANSLIAPVVGYASGTATVATGTGYTHGDSILNAGSWSVGVEDRTGVSGTAYTASFTLSVSNNWASGVVGYKPAIGAGTPSLDKLSSTDAGFVNTIDGADTQPFTSNQKASYTLQSALTPGTYYWRVRAIDPLGSNTYSAWTTARSFTVSSGTTTVSITKAARYTIKKTPALTKSQRYTIRTTPSAITKASKYTVKKTISAITRALKYGVKTSPTALTKAQRYAIKTTKKVGGRTNYLMNPNFETNDLYWGAGGGGASKVQSSAQAWTGSNSLLFTGSLVDDRVFATLSDGLPTPQTGQSYTFSAYLKGTGTLRMWVYDGLADQYSSLITLTSTWTRYSLTVTNGGTSMYAGIRLQTANSVSAYMDGAQFEQGATATAFFDGSSTGGSWAGTVGNSVSSYTMPLQYTVKTTNARRNLILNPNFEADTVSTHPANWTNQVTNGTVAFKGVANDWSQFGTQSVKIAMSTAGTQAYLRNFSAVAGETYTLSGYVKTDASCTNAALVIYDNGATSEVHIGINQQGRFSVTRTITTTGTVTAVIGIGQYTGGSSNGTVWFDGIMLEKSGSMGSYFDGSTAGGSWTGTANASISANNYLTAPLKYTVKKASAITKPLQYSIRKSLPLAKGAKYTIKRTASALTKSAQYSVRNGMGTLRDDFNTGSIDTTKWNVLHFGSAGTPAQTGGRIILSYPNPTVASDDSYLESFNRYDLTGGAASFKVVNYPVNGDISSWMSLQLDSFNRLQIENYNGFLYFIKRVDGTQTAIANVAYDPTLHAWQKISESGGTVTFWTSGDGVTWTSQATTATPFNITSMRVYLECITWSAGLANVGTFEFDNFNFTATSALITKSARYAIKKGLSLTKALKYTIKTSPTALTKATKYTVKRTASAITKQTKYAILKTLATSKALKYTISRPATAITKATRYTIKKNYSATKALKYTITKPVSAITKATRYTINKPQQITKSLQYTVKRVNIAVTKSSKYTIRTVVALTKTTRYDIKLPTVNISKAVRYAIRKTYSSTKALSYDIRKAIALTKSLKYTTRTTALALTKSLKYTIINRAAIAFSYNVKYTIRTTKAVTKPLRYAIRKVAPITKSMQYIIKRPVAISKNLSYIVTGGSIAFKTLTYTVKRTNSTSKQARYDIRLPTINLTKPVRYAVRTTTAKSKSLVYTIKRPLNLTKALSYKIRRTSSLQKALSYEVRSLHALTKAVSYRVRRQSTVTKTTSYDVRRSSQISKAVQYRLKLASSSMTKPLRYSIKSPHSMTKALQYRIPAKVVINKALTYVILLAPTVTHALSLDQHRTSVPLQTNTDLLSLDQQAHTLSLHIDHTSVLDLYDKSNSIMLK